MPLPLIIGAIAVAAGATGVAKGVSGAKKIKEAKEAVERIERRHERNQESLKKQEGMTQEAMDLLGKKEIEIMSSFKQFSDSIEKIQDRPEFAKQTIGDTEVEPVNIEKLKEVSIGAEALKGVVGSSALGTAGAFAASGATTAAVSAFGVASTGTAISGLSGAAATNATLAALGGGSLAAGGGGVALGSAILSGATLGIGLMVGGLFINHAGNKAQENVKEARAEYEKARVLIEQATKILSGIETAAQKYTKVLKDISIRYFDLLEWLSIIVNDKTSWYEFSEEEQNKIEQLVLLVTVLYRMCAVQFLLKKENKTVLNDSEINKVYDLIESTKLV